MTARRQCRADISKSNRHEQEGRNVRTTNGCTLSRVRSTEKVYYCKRQMHDCSQAECGAWRKCIIIKETLYEQRNIICQDLRAGPQDRQEQGNCISEEQVKDAFAELDLSGEQLQMVFDYLLKHKIGIGQPMDPDEFLTDEEKDYLQEYLDEVAELPTYTDGEKLAFAMSAMAGEADAQQRLIEIHLADVAEIAKLYAGQGVLLEDLVGEGNLALSFGVTMLGSLEKPQEVEGMLGKMIMDAMEEYIAEHAENSKIDKRVEDKVNKVADKARELAEELQRKVTIEELMEETGMSRKMIEDAVRMSGFKIEDIDNNAKDSL